MDESQLQTARSERYNNWGEREPIVCSDSNKNFTAMAITSRKDLSGPEKSAKYLYDITGCKGFEFVAFSNAKLERPTQLADNIILFPCFHNNTNGLSLNDPMVQASIIMSQTARYVYDGWLPIDEMRESTIRSKIRVLREVMSAFSIVSGSNFEWESKYPIAETSEESHYLNEADIGYCQVFCVKFVSTNSLKNGRFLRTFPIGFDFQCNSILRQIKARRV